MRYPLTFYVDSLPPDVGGCANGPVIRVLKKYRDDKGILEHELVHVKQWFFTLSLHSLLYLIFPEYRLWSEVEAYKEQLKHYSNDRSILFAGFIATRYGINVTQEDALKLLRR
jgi:hypothetical protein